jgi:hypothetical protein
VFRFIFYVIGSVVLFVAFTVTRLPLLKLACDAKFVFAVVCGVLFVRCDTQLNVGILVFGW